MVRGLPRNALDLLDALVSLSTPGQWIGRAALELAMNADDRTIRRNTRRLLDWSLVDVQIVRRRLYLRATDLGRALIDGHHRSQRPLEGLCAK
jgi:hypothetical protein